MFAQVNKITAHLKGIDPEPVHGDLCFRVMPDPIRFDRAGIIAERQRRGVALGAKVVEEPFRQRVGYAFAAAIFLRFLHFG